jgi:hypothetical protein
VPSQTLAGSIPRASIFDPPDGIFSVNGSQRISSPANLTINSEPFFHGDGTIPDLLSKCPTSRCTWKPYETLAVCSKCSDVSQNLQWGCATTPSDWLSDVALSDKPYPNATACGYWFGQGNHTALMSGYVVSSNGTQGEALVTRLFPLTDPDPLSRKPIFGGTLQFSDIHNPIIDFLIAGTPDGPAGAYANKTPTLNECVLHWCVNTLESSVESGRISENIAQSVQLDTSSGWPWFTFNDSQGLTHNRYLANFSLTVPQRDQPDLKNNIFMVSKRCSFTLPGNSRAVGIVLRCGFTLPRNSRAVSIVLRCGFTLPRNTWPVCVVLRCSFTLPRNPRAVCVVLGSSLFRECPDVPLSCRE